MKTGINYFRRVFRYLRPYWQMTVVTVILIVAGGVAALLTPWPLKILIDNVLGHVPPSRWISSLVGSDRKSLLWFCVIAGVLVVLTENLILVLNNYVTTKLEQKVILDFRSDLFRHAQRLPLSFHDKQRAGGLIFVINSQAGAAASLLMTIPPLAQSLLTLVGMFWVTFKINHNLAALSLVVVPFLYFSVGYYAKHIQARLMLVRNMEGESLSIVHEAMSMLKVIVSFGREKFEHDKFRDQGERTLDQRVKLTVRQTLFSLVVNMITAIGTALVLGYGASQALEGRLTTGQLIVVISYIALIYKPLEAISYTIGSLQEKFVALRMAFDLLDTVPEIRDRQHPLELGRSKGHIEFQNVQFSYSDRVDTLRGINFVAEPGKVIAIVGPTGAGKSTLVSLIPRFYEARHGHVLVDGHDVRSLRLASLRSQISIVLQEPLLFAGTIADNIRYGKLDANIDQIMDSAKAANVHEFIVSLAKGYDTEIGERGARLSGGERQRISVARAFLRDSPILILDEPTSSIDSRTESVILNALDRLMVGRTTFMIAHRLSTIRRADQILVLDKGRLVEHGKQEDLLKRNGLFAQLYMMQTGQEKKAPLAAVTGPAAIGVVGPAGAGGGGHGPRRGTPA